MIKKLKLFIACNLIFLVYYLHYFIHFIPKSAFSILIGLMIFIIPGYCWAVFFKEKTNDLILIIFLTVCISSLILISGCVFFYISQIRISSTNMLIYLFLVSNIGILLPKRTEDILKRKIQSKHLVFILIISIVIYSILYMGATRYVPPLEDQDMETQGTAYGIMHHMKPYMVTNRGTVYYFAHPLMLHLYIGYTSLFLDQLDGLSYYYQSAISAEKELEEKNTKEMVFKNWRNDLHKFYAEPHLLATRMPNIFFSSLSLIILFYLLYTLTQSFFFSVIGPIIFFTIPEVFVRLSYGGYMAVDTFCLLIMIYLYMHNNVNEKQGKLFEVLLFLSGCFAALMDQKMVIFILAVALMRILNERGNLFAKLTSPLYDRMIQGFILGILIFWTYGFLVNPKAFIEDQITYHLVQRFSLNDVRVTSSQIVNDAKNLEYPSIVGLWKEFGDHLGFPFLIVALPLTIYSIFKINEKKAILGLWFIIGGIIFSLTDWRQTKHLMLIILPLIIATLIFVSRTRLWIRSIFLIIFAFLIFNNIHIIIKLTKDFTTVSPTPIW